jgi:hypothetical protein
MSRLYDALSTEAEGYPKVYRGAATRNIYVQHLRYPFEPALIGDNLRDVEELRDRLTAFLEGAWREEAAR